jgi:trans-aconitate 2-methyltransferase
VLAPAAGDEHPVVAWTKGTTLTPFLAALDTLARTEFLAEYGAAMRRAYPPRGDGSVSFPFKRVFMVAVRGG